MKVLFAVSNDNITTSVVSKYQQKYKEIITSKNVYYFNAIIKELQRDKTYDAIVIGEDLEPISNNNYEAIDKFLIDKLDNISDEASKPTGEDIPIIFICSDRRTKTDQLLRKLFSMSIYNALVGNDRSLNVVCSLINKPRSKKEAKKYYQIETEQVDYEPGTDELVSEDQIQNILSYYKKIGQNEKKCVQAFDSISKQYDDTQLRIIVKFLPMSVKAILEAHSPRYQVLMTGGTVLSSGKDARYNLNTNPKKPNNLEFLEKDLEKTNLTEPVVIPSTMNIKNPINQGSIGSRNMSDNNFNNNNIYGNPNMNPNMNNQNMGNSYGNVNNNQFGNNPANQYGMPQQNTMNNQNQYGMPQQNSMNNQNQYGMPQQQNNMNQNNQYNNIPQQNTAGQNSFGMQQNTNENNAIQTAPVEPVKRGRGRPKKVVDAGAQIEKVKRGRGRPRKNQVEEPIVENNIPDTNTTNQINNLPNIQPQTLPNVQEPAGLPNQVPQNTSMQNINNTNTNINTGTANIETAPAKEESVDLFDMDLEQQSSTNSTGTTDTISPFDMGTTQNEVNPFDMGTSTQDTVNPFDMGASTQDTVNPFDMGASTTDTVNPFDMGTSSTDTADLFDMGASTQDTVSPFDMGGATQNEVNPFDMGTSSQNTSNPYEMPTTVNNVQNNMQQPFNTNIAKNGKVAAFIGTTKNGTSFIVNNLAQLLSQNGIRTAVIDLTKNKNAYYMFTNNDSRLMQVASTSMQGLTKGIVEGVEVNKNLTIFTAVPDEVQTQPIDTNMVIKTASNNFEIVLLDCDFSTDSNFFVLANEIYLVQTMDAFTIQPLTKFLSDLKLKNALDENKIRVVINKYIKLRKLDERMIIGGMSKYNEPSMTLQRDLFNPNKVQSVIIPFEEQTYAKYIEEIAMCQLSLNGFSQNFLASLEELKNMVFPLVAGNNFGGAQPMGNPSNFGNYNNYNSYGNDFGNNFNNANYGGGFNGGFGGAEQKTKKQKRGLFGGRKKDEPTMNQMPQQQFSNNVNDTLNKMRNNNF